MSRAQYPLMAAVLCGWFTAPAWGQNLHLLDCPEVQFFGPACVSTPPPTPTPPPAPRPAPLFSPETLAPDTPPLLLKVLEEPTLENARAFLDWQQRRMARVQEVQQLLRLLAPPRGQP